MIIVNQLIWNQWNVDHIARHDVTPEQVEEACQGNPIVRESYSGCVMVIGPTKARKMIAAVLSPVDEEAGIYFTVTARSASRRERRLYQDEKGGR